MLGYAQQSEGFTMNFLKSAGLSTVLAVAASPVLAQSAANGPATPAGPPYGYGPMWGYGAHHMWGWGFHPFASVLGIILAICVIMWVVRMVRFGGYCGHGRFRHGGYGRGTGALDILEERFAKGEIDKNEFEEKRKLLTR